MTERVYTAKETKAFEEFKKRIKDLLETRPNHTDYYLHKWLIARNYNVDQAEKMYRNSMAYKDKMKTETLLENYQVPEVLDKYMAGGFCGHDKEGSPIKVEMFGYLDMRGLMQSVKKTDFEKYKLMECEDLYLEYKRQSQKLQKPVDKQIIIFDMDKMGPTSLWRPGLNMYLHLVEVLQDNYPEMTKHLFTVNAPAIFPIIWRFCRPLVTDSMRNRMYVLGSDYKITLLKHIDPDQLPAFLGGTQTDPDGNTRCITKICQGGKVPQRYYLSETTIAEEMCESTLASGAKLKLDFEVDKPGSLLRWEFRTEEYDIGFSVTYKPNNSKTSKEKDVVPYKRFNSHQVTEDDSYTCKEPGIYAAIFDNSYSWTKTKKLLYLVELFTSSDLEFTDLDSMSTGGSWTRLYKGMQITHL